MINIMYAKACLFLYLNFQFQTCAMDLQININKIHVRHKFELLFILALFFHTFIQTINYYYSKVDEYILYTFHSTIQYQNTLV